MRKHLLAAVIFVACTSNAPDAGSKYAALTCDEVSERAVARVAQLPVSCVGVGDCVLIGAPTRSCDTSLHKGSGMTVNLTGSMDTELLTLEGEFEARCRNAPCSSTNSCICDAAPARLSCDNHACVATPRSYLEHDAPVPDAGLAGLTCNELG